jgi:hypothetical protein
MRTLILNSSNIVANSNNSVFRYVFPAGNVEFVKGDKLALASLQMFYSTFNITSAQNNNTFQYIWVDGTTNSVVFPDGFYDAPMINDYLHQVQLNNKHYLIENDTGNFVWFNTFNINISTYTIEINCYNMNATTYVIGTGTGQYTLPTGATWVVPTANIVPMIRILANNFRYIVGYNAGFYPTGVAPTYSQAPITGIPPAQTQTPVYTTIQSFSSAFVPQITPLSSYTLTCSLINNNYAVPNTLLYSFAPQGAFGEQFTLAPNQYSFLDIQTGQYNGFLIQFTDQNNLPVSIQDPNIVILLVVLSADEQKLSSIGAT